MGRTSELEQELAREGVRESRAAKRIPGKGHSRCEGPEANDSIEHEEAKKVPGWRAGGMGRS